MCRNGSHHLWLIRQHSDSHHEFKSSVKLRFVQFYFKSSESINQSQCWNCRGVGGVEPPRSFFNPPHDSVFLPWGGQANPPTSKTPPLIESSYYYKMAEIKKIENQSAISKFFGKKREVCCINYCALIKIVNCRSIVGF